MRSGHAITKLISGRTNIATCNGDDILEIRCMNQELKSNESSPESCKKNSVLSAVRSRLVPYMLHTRIPLILRLATDLLALSICQPECYTKKRLAGCLLAKFKYAMVELL